MSDDPGQNLARQIAQNKPQWDLLMKAIEDSDLVKSYKLEVPTSELITKEDAVRMLTWHVIHEGDCEPSDDQTRKSPTHDERIALYEELLPLCHSAFSRAPSFMREKFSRVTADEVSGWLSSAIRFIRNGGDPTAGGV